MESGFNFEPLTPTVLLHRAHRRRAREIGVPAEQIEDLFLWRESPRFTEAQRAALALAEAMLAGNVTDGVFADVARYFAHSEVVEPALTAGFQAMVPRVLNTLTVRIEQETLYAPVPSSNGRADGRSDGKAAMQ